MQAFRHSMTFRSSRLIVNPSNIVNSSRILSKYSHPIAFRSSTFSHSANVSSSTVKLNKILIANRGEIACRVIRTAKRLGIKTVAVYSDADVSSDHVKLADEAVYIGASPAAESYLRGDKIVEACLKTGAQAVHPGYGFLSENLQFCEQCKQANIIFIGPPPYAIRAMGSKSESKDIMIAAGVPVTPGYHGQDQKDATLFAHAKRIGFPLMIKAVSGGGGKGMRAVHQESKFLESLESCRREAKRSFNDDAVLLEKLITAPRHVEVQIFGGPDGKAVHLFERDCSVQRRHQKVLEEAPAPNLDKKTREAMHNAAVACAEAVGYRGAGTVEFLIDSKTHEFYFCEMNTRLQVEHPVTEMITGNDLVEWQLLVAAGYPIPLTQAEIVARGSGCAIEARIYAENPMKDFLPATGLISHLTNPAISAKEDGLRVDTGISSGNTISTFYDPMIAKLIAFGENREVALDKLQRALRDYQVAGLANNIDFLVSTIQRPEFVEAKATTAFFEHNMPAILSSIQSCTSEELFRFSAFASAAILITKQLSSAKVSGLWDGTGHDTHAWRSHGVSRSSFQLMNDKVPIDVDVDQLNPAMMMNLSYPSEKSSPITARGSIEVVSHQLITQLRNSVTWTLSLVVNNQRLSGTVSILNNSIGRVDVVDIWIDGQLGAAKTHYQLLYPHVNHASAGDLSSKPVILSPMPGKVVKVFCTDGAKVKQGDTIAVIEAMKMEHSILAPTNGIIKIYCSEGATIGEGSKIAEVVNE